LKFALDLNSKVIDASMRLHNFIVDFREGGGQSVLESIALDQSVFDNDCHQYLAINLEKDPEGGNDGGVYGGKQDIRHDDNFDQYQGGHPKADKADVNRRGDNGETISEMKLQDGDSFVQVPIGISRIIACTINNAVFNLISHCLCH
jgi:hypothetical protein